MIRIISFFPVYCIASCLWGTSCLEAAKANPLGVFSFDLDRLAKESPDQVAALKKIGFTGVTLNYSGSRKQVQERFAAMKKAADAADFEIYAVHKVCRLGKDNAVVLRDADWAIAQAKKVEADFWLIIRAEAKHQVSEKPLLDFIDAVADKCARQDVRCVLYPHDNTLMEDAEDAIAILKKTNRKDLSISLHLCHEIRAGNGKRLGEVAQKVKPYLHLATISGADNQYVDGSQDWSDSIQPLDRGDFDVSAFVKALQAIDYRGPLILHTYGLQKAKADHHQRSFAIYQKFFQ